MQEKKDIYKNRGEFIQIFEGFMQKENEPTKKIREGVIQHFYQSNFDDVSD